VGTLDDIERDRLSRQLRAYRRLQEHVARQIYERRFGRLAESVAEIEAAFPSGSISTIDPHRHLTPEAIQRILSTATGA